LAFSSEHPEQASSDHGKTHVDLMFRRWTLCFSVLVFVENVHRRVFLHVMIPVQMFLQLIVRVEGPFDVFDGTDEAEDLILHHDESLQLTTSLLEEE
jgi:hypothetical protein